MSELPPNWATATLSQVIGPGGEFSDGDWVESKDQDPNGPIRLLQLADVGDGVFLDKSIRFVNDEQFERLRCTPVLPGDVLVARMPDPLGRACLAPPSPQKRITVVDVAIVRPGPDSVSPAWLMHWVNAPSTRRTIQLQASGTTRQRISRGKLAEIELPIPPRAEQVRIAGKVDAIRTRVDACRERLDRMPAILRKFREAVLEAAVSGRLTEVWRRENKKSFNWERVVLSDVAESRLGKMLDKVKNRGDLRPYLRNINVRWFVFDLSDIQELRVSPAEASELAVAQGDVLVCEGGEPGRCAVWRGPEGQYIYQKALHRVRAGPSLIPEWICYCLKNAATSGRLEASFTGTTIKHLTGVSLAGFDFRLPPIAEQIEAKRRVEELLALADQLEAKYRAAVERVERLTPSVLAKAFRGELVPQDPEDEPASVLLERIRAESSAEDRSGSAGRSPGRRAGTGGLRQAAVRAGGAAGKKRGRRSRAS